MTEKNRTTRPTRTCEVDGCERKHKAYGLCTRHHCRFKKTGTTDPPRRPTFEERFWPKVNKAGPVPEYRPDLGPCWLWTASLRAGRYGQFAERHGKILYAHRVAYELLRGPIPPGLQIDHLCRVLRCVNPYHLEPVTNRENVLRGEAPVAKVMRTNTCQRGHHDDWAPNGRPKGKQRRTCRACLRIRDRQKAAQVASEAA